MERVSVVDTSIVIAVELGHVLRTFQAILARSLSHRRWLLRGAWEPVRSCPWIPAEWMTSKGFSRKPKCWSVMIFCRFFVAYFQLQSAVFVATAAAWVQGYPSSSQARRLISNLGQRFSTADFGHVAVWWRWRNVVWALGRSNHTQPMSLAGHHQPCSMSSAPGIVESLGQVNGFLGVIETLVGIRFTLFFASNLIHLKLWDDQSYPDQVFQVGFPTKNDQVWLGTPSPAQSKADMRLLWTLQRFDPKKVVLASNNQQSATNVRFVELCNKQSSNFVTSKLEQFIRLWQLCLQLGVLSWENTY